MNQDKIKDMLVRHEGLRLHAYKCSEGFLTLGVGRNLDANGISEDEAMYMLDNDIKRVPVSYTHLTLPTILRV